MAHRILVVDDEIPIQDLLRDALGAAGFEVATAGDAAAALALVRDNLFDAAILDFALPDMNGVMLHHRLRQLDGELAEKCLFVSGHTQTEDDRGYFDDSAGGFLSKPFDVREIVDALHRIIGA